MAKHRFDVGLSKLGRAIVSHYTFVAHDGLRRMAEHLRHFEVEGSLTVGLFKGEVCITRSFAHHVERCTLALSDGTHAVDVFFVDEQSHTLLALVGYNLLGRKRGVTHR